MNNETYKRTSFAKPPAPDWLALGEYVVLFTNDFPVSLKHDSGFFNALKTSGFFMNDAAILDVPDIYAAIEAKKEEIGFNMPSDIYIGTLLKTLIASKPKATVLELGTGIGLSLAWMIEGLDTNSSLTTLDNNPELSSIAKSFFGKDERVNIVCTDGSEWLKGYAGDKFDLIFADAWPGKYSEVEKTLDLVKSGGFYVIDDMSKQPNWPDGHEENVQQLIAYLESRSDFSMTKMNWSTGVIIMTKKAS